jgi:hypothetical protein
MLTARVTADAHSCSGCTAACGVTWQVQRCARQLCDPLLASVGVPQQHLAACAAKQIDPNTLCTEQQAPINA